MILSIYFNTLFDFCNSQTGEASVSFYTNDLPGIIEGITPQGVISAKKLIKVVE